MGIFLGEGPQYLVVLADGRNYTRVEPWQGGLSAAKREARAVGGYVVALDEWLCSTGEVVADYRAPKSAPAPTPLDTGKVTYERLVEPSRLHRELEDCLAAVGDYLNTLYPDNSYEPSAPIRRMALGALVDLEQLARELRANIEGR